MKVKKAHAVTQLSYLASELCGFHQANTVLLALVFVGGVIFLLCNDEPMELAA